MRRLIPLIAAVALGSCGDSKTHSSKLSKDERISACKRMMTKAGDDTSPDRVDKCAARLAQMPPKQARALIRCVVTEGKDPENCAKQSSYVRKRFSEQKSSALAQRQAANNAQLLAMSMFKIARDLAVYKQAKGTYPASLAELETLTKRPATDAWKNAYRYRRQGAGYEVCSNGIDGVPKTKDDKCSRASGKKR